MSKSFVIVTCLMLAIFLGACDSQTTTNTGPQLVQDVTLMPTTPASTRVLSATPERTVIATLAPPTNEVLSPLQERTVDADFVLVTPTLPPSKTPTQTPTITQTPTYTPTPTVTVTATATLPQFPTSVIIPITAVIPNPLPQVCQSIWFFADPRPPSCPVSQPLVGQGVFQTFQNGYMIWVGVQDAVYVFYTDTNSPRWEVYRDEFDQGMQEDDPAYNNAPSGNLWQPRRGFGMLWRGNAYVRDRIGWATEVLERPYSVTVQNSTDGTLFISDPTGGVFSVLPGGQIWQRYAGFG